MEDRKTIKLSVFKGWASSENIDAKINIYQVQTKVPDPLKDVQLEDSLKGALRYSANVVGRTTFLDSQKAFWSSFVLMWVLMMVPIWFIVAKGNDVTLQLYTHLIISLTVIFLWSTLFERYIILRRSRERYEQSARELEPHFRKQGWQLEFVVQNWNSTMGVVAFYKLTPIVASEEDLEATNLKPAKIGSAEEGEEWVCASNLSDGHNGCLKPKAPSLLDGIPKSMKASVDVLLWGSLTDACVKVRMEYHSNQSCNRMGVEILSSFVFMLLFVALTMYTIEHEYVGSTFYIVSLCVLPLVYIYVYYGMLSITAANVARHSFHPQMKAIVKEFGPKFEAVGFRMEYIMEDQEIPIEFLRKGSCKSGQGFFRFVSVTNKYYERIADPPTNSGWLV